MIIGKKAAFLTAAAGALILAGASGASACGPDGGHPSHPSHHVGGSVEQSNTCSTAPGVLALTGLSPDIEYDTNCLNVDASGGGASEQSNNCSTAPQAATLTGLLAPAPEIEYNTNCTNVAF
ncbi:hypothetical protein OG535_17010 [Kitasatospora sp. NBC_00085]|uniref:hypothetical protein n=1 Tax=unclassified Kitasatospora TaxID=2633591 RepID=UPI003244387F